ncbi:MAG: serine--tRNA ligase, partial [Bacteroidales bacterium]|nr:serine--tRNA ligase [Bacteroidales bacterium]
MLTINYLKDNSESVISALKIKNFDAKLLIGQFLEQDIQRRSIQATLDNTLSELNNLSKEIGILFKAGKAQEANEAKISASELSEQSKKMRLQLTEVESFIRDILVQIPNIPHPTVPLGKSDADNVLVRNGGKMPTLYKDAKP